MNDKQAVFFATQFLTHTCFIVKDAIIICPRAISTREELLVILLEITENEFPYPEKQPFVVTEKHPWKLDSDILHVCRTDPSQFIAADVFAIHVSNIVPLTSNREVQEIAPATSDLQFQKDESVTNVGIDVVIAES